MTITFKNTIAALLISIVALVGAAAIFLGSTGSAMAPGPAKNGSTYLESGAGNTRQGTWIETGEPTTIWSWPGSAYNVSPKPPVGAPCTTGSLVGNRKTYSVIYDDGAGPYCW